MKVKEYFNLMTGIVFHPAATFRQIKRYRDNLSWWFVIIVFALFLVAFIFNQTLVHYPFRIPDVRGGQFILSVVRVVLPLVTWGFAAYLMSSIMDGEMKLKEFLVSTAYALIPSTVLLIPLTGLSYLFNTEQGFFYNGAIAVLLAWTVLLLIGSFKVLNNYEAWPFVKGLFGAILCIIVIWCIVFLLYAIINQATGVFTSFFRELMLLNS